MKSTAERLADARRFEHLTSLRDEQLSKMTHTPGPWTISGNIVRQTQGQEIICACSLAPHERQQQANAHLIAAAPELLEALEGLREQLRAHVKLDVKRHYSLMVADAAAGTAIVKATQS